MQLGKHRHTGQKNLWSQLTAKGVSLLGDLETYHFSIMILVSYAENYADFRFRKKKFCYISQNSRAIF